MAEDADQPPGHPMGLKGAAVHAGSKHFKSRGFLLTSFEGSRPLRFS